jgi:hypothetical protein
LIVDSQKPRASLLEQDKHSIQPKHEPFANRSHDLWNTLAIWLEALDTKEVADTTRFLMVTNKALPECIAQQISRAHFDGDVDDCIKALQGASREPPQKIATLVQRVLRQQSRANLKKLICQCELADGTQSTSGSQLRTQIVSHLQLPQWSLPSADSIVNELLGWMHQTAMGCWQQKQPAWIRRENFVNQFHSILDFRKRQITRERAEHLIPVTDENVGKEKARPFVRQLHLVSDDEPVVDTAIREYIRCNIEKARLSADGNITDDDWKAFEIALFSRWDKIRQRVKRVKKDSAEKDAGYEIFTETTEDYREKLAGADTEQVYLTSGTYHRLADMVRLGWHPRFEELMRELLEES